MSGTNDHAAMIAALEDGAVLAVLRHWIETGDAMTTAEGAAVVGVTPSTFARRMQRRFERDNGWLAVAPSEAVVHPRDRNYGGVLSPRRVGAWKPGAALLRALARAALAKAEGGAR